MKIFWHGHSCFAIESSEGVIVFDPYENQRVPGYPNLSLSADLVLCSHEHRDHSATEVISLSGKTISPVIKRLPTFHDEEQGAKRGENIIHILTLEGMRVAHFGDLGCIPTPEQLVLLQGLDAVMIPVGGFYTIDAPQAQAMIDAIAPRVVIPMHYRKDDMGFEVISELTPFLALCQNPVHYEGNCLALSCDTPHQTAILQFQA